MECDRWAVLLVVVVVRDKQISTITSLSCNFFSLVQSMTMRILSLVFPCDRSSVAPAVPTIIPPLYSTK